MPAIALDATSVVLKMAGECRRTDHPEQVENGAQGSKRWHEHITGRINGTVKLVGPTISCEGSPRDGKVDGEWRTNPHVQSYVLATDQVPPACCRLLPDGARLP